MAKFPFNKSNEFIIKFFLVSNWKNYDFGNYSDDEKNPYNMVKIINDLKINIPCIDSCVVVTNRGVYKIVLR